jgi:hypothetical protein
MLSIVHRVRTTTCTFTDIVDVITPIYEIATQVRCTSSIEMRSSEIDFLFGDMLRYEWPSSISLKDVLPYPQFLHRQICFRFGYIALSGNLLSRSVATRRLNGMC